MSRAPIYPGWNLTGTSLDLAVGVLGSSLIKKDQRANRRSLFGSFGLKERDDVFLHDGGRNYGLRVLWHSHDFLVGDTIEYCANPKRRPVPQIPLPGWVQEALPRAVIRIA